jgi:hypothetical protein
MEDYERGRGVERYLWPGRLGSIAFLNGKWKPMVTMPASRL